MHKLKQSLRGDFATITSPSPYTPALPLRPSSIILPPTKLIHRTTRIGTRRMWSMLTSSTVHMTSRRIIFMACTTNELEKGEKAQRRNQIVGSVALGSVYIDYLYEITMINLRSMAIEKMPRVILALIKTFFFKSSPVIYIESSLLPSIF